MSLPDKDIATTDIASFFRNPDLNACNCITRQGSIWPAMFGASGILHRPSKP